MKNISIYFQTILVAVFLGVNIYGYILSEGSLRLIGLSILLILGVLQLIEVLVVLRTKRLKYPLNTFLNYYFIGVALFFVGTIAFYFFKIHTSSFAHVLLQIIPVAIAIYFIALQSKVRTNQIAKSNFLGNLDFIFYDFKMD